MCEVQCSERGCCPGGRARMESYVFRDEEESFEQFLELRTLCLGDGAKPEHNVVEVTALNHRGKKVSVPVANLHLSCLPMVSLGEFELKTPVTFRLKSGTGPVSVSGLHLIAYEDDESDMSEEEENEEEIVPIKPAKKKQKL